MQIGASGPLYAQVEARLAASITEGELRADDQLPPEESLIERFQVSRTTVRQAIQNLAARGLVEIRRGRGTFVSQHKVTQELTELSGFVEDMRALGYKPSARVIDKAIVKAGDSVARQLAISAGTKVVRIQRVRLADGTAMSFDETYLPLELGKKIMRDDLELEPIFSLLEQKYDTPLLEAEYRLEAVAAAPFVAQALGIAAGAPIFRIERTSYGLGKKAVDYELLHYRADLIRFTTRLARNPRPARHRANSKGRAR
jgi:GntR family transcriptional regulator